MFLANANLTETSMHNLLLACGAEPVQVPTKYYFSTASRSTGLIKKLWEQRVSAAAPYLIKKGYKALVHDLDTPLNKVDWERVPSGLFVDMVFGLDCLVQLEDGTVIGVDCTTSEDDHVLIKKKEKLNKLRPMLEHLGIDAVVIAQVLFDEYGFTALSEVKKRNLIKGMKRVLNKDYSAKWLHRWALDLREDTTK